MGDWNGAPQQLLASVTEGVQRFTKQLQPRRLEFKSPQATQTNASKRPVPHRAPVVDFKSHQVVVDGEGVLTPLQVCPPPCWADLFSHAPGHCAAVVPVVPEVPVHVCLHIERCAPVAGAQQCP